MRLQRQLEAARWGKESERMEERAEVGDRYGECAEVGQEDTEVRDEEKMGSRR